MSAQDAVRISRDVDAPARAVWDVLADGWLYPLWVVGAARMRDVDHGWPAGAAEVILEVEDLGERARVHIREDAVAGPGALVPKPARQLAIGPRNRESLRRLVLLVEGRARGR